MAITAEELNIILSVRDDKFSKQIDRATKKVTGFSQNVQRRSRDTTQAFNRMGRSAGANRAALQNASFQIQDIITQITMGTSATRALSVQLPQLLGGFGALGAAVGVGVGALGMFAPTLFDSSDAAGELEDDLKSLAAAMDNLNAAENSLSAGIAGLRDEYGKFSVEALALLDIQRQMADVQAKQALGRAFSGIGSQFGDFSFGASAEDILQADAAVASLTQRYMDIQAELEGVTQLTNDQIAALEAEKTEIEGLIVPLNDIATPILDLQEKLGVSADRAREVAAALADMAQAEGPQSQAEAAQRLSEVIFDVTEGLSKADDETVELYQRLLEATQQGLQLAAIDYATSIGAGADQAARLADNLALARSYQVGNSALGEFGGVPTGLDAFGGAGDYRYDTPSTVNAGGGFKSGAGRKGRKRGGGGGGGSKSASEQKTAMQRLIEEVALNEQLLGLSDERQQVMRRLGDEAANYSKTEIDGIIQRISAYENEKAALEAIQEQQQSIADTVESSMSDAFMSIVDGTKSAEDAFKDMARSIIAELLRVLVVQQLVGRFNGATGQGSGIVGSIMGAFTKRAAGGPVKAGSPYMVGEHGAEPFIPSQGGRVLSVGQAQSALAGGSGGQSINQTINISTGVAQTVRAEMKTMMPQIIQAAKAGVADEARRNPSYRGSF